MKVFFFGTLLIIVTFANYKKLDGISIKNISIYT